MLLGDIVGPVIDSCAYLSSLGITPGVNSNAQMISIRYSPIFGKFQYSEHLEHPLLANLSKREIESFLRSIVSILKETGYKSSAFCLEFLRSLLLISIINMILVSILLLCIIQKMEIVKILAVVWAAIFGLYFLYKRFENSLPRQRERSRIIAEDFLDERNEYFKRKGLIWILPKNFPSTIALKRVSDCAAFETDDDIFLSKPELIAEYEEYDLLNL
jgi:hypothetical protein